MAIGTDHEMAIVVREQIQNDETGFPPEDDQVFLVLGRTGFLAENATLHRLCGLFDVRLPPGSPKDFHPAIS
jgi:hypothetical protein